MATRTYRATAFLQAARRLGVAVVVGSERRQALARHAPGTTLALDLRHPDRAARQIAAFAAARPLAAVVGVDDDTTLVAAVAAEALGLPHNPVAAVRASRDKYVARQRFAAAGLPSPRFARVPLDADPGEAARAAPYPCVLKPIALAASRGVIRADDPAEFVQAFRRIAAMLAADGAGQTHLLVESFLPGPEVALEGLLLDGALRVLALFDKPDPLDGPYFEETLYVTPSRLPATTRAAIAATAGRAAAALGLRDGPLHAELRVGDGGPYVLEVAARSIGGLCSNALRFGTGLSLEELILRHALAAHAGAGEAVLPEREACAAGVLMLPIPRAGTLRAVRGRAEALTVPGVEEVTITIPLGQPVVPLPEGDRYLGFVFARAATPAAVEAALREAHRRLGFVIAAPGEAADSAGCLPATPTRRLLPISGQ
ncbi:MAG TPA: ATP-grasp domain-containing protein [Chloroflexota bacterium]|nr:ATP-grasp domain-containing protein [Chloroflexota bacterium]